MVKSNMVAVEVQGPNCESLLFRPLMKRIRGRFDVRQLPNPGELLRQFPDPIPGQRIRLDLANAVGSIVEPLHEKEHADTAERIAKRGWELPDKVEEHSNADLATWLYFMKGAVECGLAKVVEGELPETIDGEPVTEFITKRAVDPAERLAVAMEKQNKLLAELLAAK